MWLKFKTPSGEVKVVHERYTIGIEEDKDAPGRVVMCGMDNFEIDSTPDDAFDHFVKREKS